MSKIISATCSEAGIVSIGSIVVPDALVLSEGHQSSSGLLFLDEFVKVYLPSSAADIKTVIEKLENALEDVASALTDAGGKITTLGQDGSTIVSKASEITATRAELTTLKGALK